MARSSNVTVHTGTHVGPRHARGLQSDVKKAQISDSFAESDDRGDYTSSEEAEEGTDQTDENDDDDVDDSEDVEESDEDEGPGYAQFVDAEDSDEDVSSDDDEDSESSDEEARLTYLPQDLLRREIEAVPMSKVLKARRALKSDATTTNSAPTEADVASKRAWAKQQLRELQQGSTSAPRKAEPVSKPSAEKRETKNAPTVMSTKRPVSRLRNVVDPVGPAKARDPRFDSLSAGPVNLDLHQKSYNFLPSMYQKEVQSLRDTYGKLRRMEAHHAGPRARSQQALQIREEREKVERALRRAESQQNERVRRERERSVKAEFKKENQRRVEAGKKPFFPKRAQFQEAVLRKRFEGLGGDDQAGSSAALRKAMDRKRRKEAQKDKKSLDAALGGGARTDIIPTRRGFHGGATRPAKRSRR